MVFKLREFMKIGNSNRPPFNFTELVCSLCRALFFSFIPANQNVSFSEMIINTSKASQNVVQIATRTQVYYYNKFLFTVSQWPRYLMAQRRSGISIRLVCRVCGFESHSCQIFSLLYVGPWYANC